MPTSWHSELEAARRHALEAERHLIWQMAIIEELARGHHQEAADHARKVLATLAESLERARDRVRMLERG